MSFTASPLFSSIPLRLAVAIGMAGAVPAVLAQAPLPPGVGIYLENAVVGIGGSSYASSGTVTIYSGGGLVVDPTAYGATYGLTSANKMPLGLTTATLSSIGSNIPYGHATGEASATADLAGGVLRATTASFADVPYRQVGPVAARVITTSFMQDKVTFAVASASGADVTVTAHLDGSYALSDPYYGAGNATLAVGFGGSFSYYGREDIGGQPTATPGAVIGDFTRYSFSNETPAGFDFTGTLHVTDGERVPMHVGLYVDCSYSQCGFGDTARIGLSVPDGVTFTSDSGVFLGRAGSVAAVPEPGTWASLLAGVGALGFLSRQRRRSSRL